MPPKPPRLERRRSSNFSSSAYNFKISLYATEFKDLSRLCEPWHCIEFQFGFGWDRCWLGTKEHFPETEFWKVFWILRRRFSEVHGFRLGTLYISLRAERAGFDGRQSKWLAVPCHRHSHYLASMLKVCFFI